MILTAAIIDDLKEVDAGSAEHFSAHMCKRSIWASFVTPVTDITRSALPHFSVAVRPITGL